METPMQNSRPPQAGKTMKQIVAARLAKVPAGAINPTYTPLNAAESDRNYKIAAGLRQTAHVNNIRTFRFLLPKDGRSDDSIRKAQTDREREWYRQSNMPWGNGFMRTSTDVNRLNNPAQYSAVRQRQLTIPNTYGQFYAFMHALSAAFGSFRP